MVEVRLSLMQRRNVKWNQSRGKSRLYSCMEIKNHHVQLYFNTQTLGPDCPILVRCYKETSWSMFKYKTVWDTLLSLRHTYVLAFGLSCKLILGFLWVPKFGDLNWRNCVHFPCKRRLHSHSSGRRHRARRALAFHFVPHTHNRWILGNHSCCIVNPPLLRSRQHHAGKS